MEHDEASKGPMNERVEASVSAAYSRYLRNSPHCGPLVLSVLVQLWYHTPQIVPIGNWPCIRYTASEVYTCMYVYTYVYYICIHIRTYTHMYVYVYIYIYAYMDQYMLPAACPRIRFVQAETAPLSMIGGRLGYCTDLYGL